MWNHLVTGTINPKPLILIGPEWNCLLQKLFESFEINIPLDQRKMVRFAQNIKDAFDQLEQAN